MLMRLTPVESECEMNSLHGSKLAWLWRIGRGARRGAPWARGGEQGQSLILFAFGLVGFIGLVAMSVDVGRVVWARTQMQSAAAGMPDTNQATTNANQEWTSNSGPIQSQGKNVLFAVTFPANTNRGVAIHVEADIDTWFARVVGLDHWHVTADAEAASQVLDISLVMDISQSMCDDTCPRVDQRPNMSPGGGTVPTLTQAIIATDTVLHVSDTAPFVAPVQNHFTGGVVGYGIGGQSGSTPYWRYLRLPAVTASAEFLERADRPWTRWGHHAPGP